MLLLEIPERDLDPPDDEMERSELSPYEEAVYALWSEQNADRR